MIIDFFLYLYSFLLAMLYTLGIIKEEFKQSDGVALVTGLIIHLPYLYIYLWKDSERWIYGVFTQGIIVLVPMYLYFSLDRNNADFFTILVLTITLAAPTLTLFSRQYFHSCPRGLSWLMCRPNEETLALIKPDGMQYKAEIINMLQESGFDIVDDLETTLSPQLVAKWYADKLEKPYYADLERYMTSGPVQVLRLSRQKGIKKLRKLVGPTDAELARKKYKNTIRGRFGTDIQQNAIHASDSKKAAKKEIGLFWDKEGKSTRRTLEQATIYQDTMTQKKLDLIWESVQRIQNNDKSPVDEETLKMERSLFGKIDCSSCPTITATETVTKESYYFPSLILSVIIIGLFIWNAYNERKQRLELTKALDKIQNKLNSLSKDDDGAQSDSKKKGE